MNYFQDKVLKGANCFDVTKRSLIEGAISPMQDFIIKNKFAIENSVVSTMHRDSIKAFLPVNSKIVVDVENKIFIGDAGVVFAAYDFSKYPKEKMNMIIRKTLDDYQFEYPGYKFTIREGQFPIAINGSYSWHGYVERGITINMSTHILYLTNYKDFLSKDKVMQKKMS